MRPALREWLITAAVFATVFTAGYVVVVVLDDDDPATECETVTEYDDDGRPVRSTMVCK